MLPGVETPCPRCFGWGYHKAGVGERKCFKCAGTGDVTHGSGHKHPKQTEGLSKKKLDP